MRQMPKQHCLTQIVNLFNNSKVRIKLSAHTQKRPKHKTQ